MKAIKIILGIITLLFVGFLLTGLLVKETIYQTQITIDKPVANVFELINDKTRIKEWITDVKSVEVMKENLAIAGSMYKITVDNRGNEVTMTQKVLAHVPNEKVTFYFDAENMLKTDDYAFMEDEDGKTTVTKTSNCQSDSYIMACIFPYFKTTFQEMDQKYLNNLKVLAENQ